MSGEAAKTRILVVDDHPIVRHGLAQLINQDPGLEVCGEAEDVPSALQQIEKLEPDMATVDVSLRGRSGLDLIKDIRVRFPGFPVLVVSMHDESLYAERVVRAGARGYITKQEATERMITAIRDVLAGKIYVSERIASKVMAKLAKGTLEPASSELEALSDRELEVYELIGQGMGTREIAESLHLSVKTIETYRAHIKRKLNLKNSTQLLQHAIEWRQAQASGG